MPKIGCNTLLYGGHDLDTALRYIALAGYAGIELSSVPGMAEHAELGRGRDYARALRAQVESHGLECFHLGIHPQQLPEAEGQRRLMLSLELASEMGVPLVLTGTSGYPQTEQAFAEAIAVLARAARRARELGLRLGVKPHVGTPIYNTSSTLAMLRALHEDNVGLDFDVSHIYRAGEDPAAAFVALAPYVFTVRIRDAASRALQIGPPEIQVPGRGEVDLLGVLRAMQASGYAGDISLDVVGTFDYEPERILALIAETRGWLRCALAQLNWS